MPVTLPAHPAAILPLTRLRALPPAALVVGSCAPDAAYMLFVPGRISHSFHGIFLFALPMGLLLYAWAELWILPALRRSLPASRIQWARFFQTRGLPDSARGWMAAALAIALGAFTHVLWDGFGHRQHWPAVALYPNAFVHLGAHSWSVAALVQLGSSIVGSAITLSFLAARYRTLPEVAPPARPFSELWLPTAIGAAGALAIRLSHPFGRGFDDLYTRTWFTFWATATGAIIGLTIAGVMQRSIERREPTDSAPPSP